MAQPRRLVFAGALGMCLAAAVAAQTKPDFSGSWIRDEAKSTSQTGGRATVTSGATLPIGVTEIQQTPAALTITNEIMGMSAVYVLKLDGSDSVNRNGAMMQTTRTHWSGAQLITEGAESQTTSQGHEEWTLKATRGLDARGQLIVDTSRTNRQGVVTTSHQVFTRRPR